MSVRIRHTKGHTKNRRSHHSLSEPALSKCQNCGHPHVSHKVCTNCGQYRGRQVVDVKSQEERKERRQKAKQKELGKDPNVAEAPEEETIEQKPRKKEEAKKAPEVSETVDKSRGKPLSAEDLSRH